MPLEQEEETNSNSKGELTAFYALERLPWGQCEVYRTVGLS